MAQVSIRSATEVDVPHLGDIYRAAIRTVGESYYAPAQVAAWASYPDDEAVFRSWILEASTFVAERCNSELVGFGGLEKTGRISSLFVLPQCMHHGIGSALLMRIIGEAESRHIRELTTEASEFSKPLFEKFGFDVQNLEYTMFKGVGFARYAMRKPL